MVFNHRSLFYRSAVPITIKNVYKVIKISWFRGYSLIAPIVYGRETSHNLIVYEISRLELCN